MTSSLGINIGSHVFEKMCAAGGQRTTGVAAPLEENTLIAPFAD